MSVRLVVMVEDEATGRVIAREEIGHSDSLDRAMDGMSEVAEAVTTLFEDAGLEDLLPDRGPRFSVTVGDMSTTIWETTVDLEYIANHILADYLASPNNPEKLRFNSDGDVQRIMTIDGETLKADLVFEIRDYIRKAFPRR